MTYQNLPPEILLKIGKYLTSEKDFVSFTLTDRRTFLFFSKENAIWREKLEDYDKMTADALEEEGDHLVSCPAKKIFLQRSKSEHNWRNNNFRVSDVCQLPNRSFRSFSNAQYQDFFVRLHDITDLKIWHISWVDPSEENRIRSGTLEEPKIADKCEFYRVFAASKKILIVTGYERWRSQVESKTEVLVAINLTRSDDLRIMWETRRQTLTSFYFTHQSVVVVNSKIYLAYNHPNGTSLISILSPETGQTLAMLNLNLIGPLIHLFQPQFQAVNDKVEWIPIWTIEKLSTGKEEERILLLNLETEEVRQAINDNKTKPRRYYNITMSKDFIFTTECLEEDENIPEDLTCSLYRIPSGELLVDEESRNLHFDVDLGEGTIHVWKEFYRRPPYDWSVTSYSSSKPPKYFFTDHQNRKCVHDGHNIYETLVINNSFVSPGIDKGVLSLSVEPFEYENEATSRKIRKRIVETEEVLYVPQMHIMRSKAVLAIRHRDSAELVLLDFAI